LTLALQHAAQEHNIDPVIRERTVDVLTRHIDDALRYQRDYGNRNRSVYLWSLVRVGKLYGAYVTVLYLFVKLLHLGNVLVQFIMLNKFLETSDYPLFGGHVLWDLLMVNFHIKRYQP
jgi:hypothetical protein